MIEALIEAKNYQGGNARVLKGLLNINHYNHYEVCYCLSTAWAAQIQKSMAA